VSERNRFVTHSGAAADRFPHLTSIFDK
jgi:hypothetical protein